MKVTYLGTGAAEGIPALFCNCSYCRQVKKSGGRDVRSRSQVLIDGELSIDFPPDSFYHAAFFGVDMSQIAYVLFTHTHMDHFYAHDFVLRGYKFAHDMKQPVLDLFMNEEGSEVFTESVHREMRWEICDTVRPHVVKPFIKVEFDEWRIYPLRAKHTSQEPLLYLIEKGDKRILHLSDTGPLPEENFEFLKKIGGAPIDLITFDCTFLFSRTNENARHMGLYENQEIFERLFEIGLADVHTKKVITHFSHNSAPTKEALERAEREFGVIAAYDGMTIEI